MKRLFTLLIYLLVFALILGGCAAKEENPSDEPQQSVDANLPDIDNAAVEAAAPIEKSRAEMMLDLMALMDQSENRSWLGLTNEQMLEDFDFLYQTLKDNYPYFGVVKRVTGFDMDSGYLETRAQIERCQDDMDFFLTVMEYIRRTEYAGHLNFNYGDESAVALDSIYDDFIENYYYEEALPDENVTTQNIEDGKIAYININSFTVPYDEDQEIIFDFYEQIKDYDHLIIDISNNGGGGMGYYADLLIGPNITETKVPLNFTFAKAGDLNVQEWTELGSMGSRNPIDQSPRERTEFLRDRWSPYLDDEMVEIMLERIADIPFPPAEINMDDFAEFDVYSVSFFTIEPTGIEKAFSGDIWVLVSDKVYSSSEAFALTRKQTGFATVVGTQTGGDGIGIDPFRFSLPNSGFRVAYGSSYGTTLEGRGSEEFGTTPDIISPEGESPLDTCLRAIAALD